MTPNWPTWFAWRPVRISVYRPPYWIRTSRWAWLRRVKRRTDGPFPIYAE